MSLRLRLTLLSVALTAITVAGFGGFAYAVFVRQQDNQLHALLRDELARVSALLARPQLGASFRSEADGSTLLQFVTEGGAVVQSFGDPTPLPDGSVPHLIERAGRTYLAGSTPWPGTGGTLRLALDASGMLAARRGLATSLLVSGAVMALLAALAGLLVTRRTLAPLQRVARATHTLDARSPADVPYDGPRDEVYELTLALNDALGRIRSRTEEERAFLVEIAHELAGPLTLVTYHLEAVQRDLPDHPRLHASADAARELLRTSQDLLVLARGELERPLEMAVCDLSGLVRRVQNEYPGVAAAPAAAAEVVGDPERLMQAIRNIVRNGVQAAGSEERVAIGVDAGEREVTVTVTDDGPGMDAATLERLDQGRPPLPGSASGRRGAGVGLSIARSILAQHGGSLEVASELGVGSRFTLRLPSLASRLERVPPRVDGGPAGAPGEA